MSSGLVSRVLVSRVKEMALRLLSAIASRHAVLLPAQAGHEESILERDLGDLLTCVAIKA
jgi:hypothetical protein